VAIIDRESFPAAWWRSFDVADADNLDGFLILAVTEQDHKIMPYALVIDRLRLEELASGRIRESTGTTQGSRISGQSQQLLFNVILKWGRPTRQICFGLGGQNNFPTHRVPSRRLGAAAA
jgi:hypothetical protein